MNIVFIIINFIINTLFIITSVAFFLWMLRHTLYWVWLWQVKEYRLDRFFAHITETTQGRMLFLSPMLLFKWVLLFAYITVMVSEQVLLPYSFIVTGIYVYGALLFLYEIVTRRLKRPQLTGKALLLVVLTLVSIYGLYWLAIIQQGFLWILILDRMMPFILMFFVFFLAIPTMLFQDYKIDLAVKKRQSFPHLRVIGVTGSFGKSSTKEYTAQILSKKFNVVKTLGTNNTPIGLSNAILGKLKKDTEIFVAEMGAYKRGEIAQLCEIAQPHIGIITAIATQHLSLFGSAENLAKAKFELIQSLPANGLAIFNGSNPGALELSKKARRNKVLYGIEQKERKLKHPFDIQAVDVHVEKQGVSFSVVLKKKKVRFSSSLIGGHMVENMLPGIYLGHLFGMSDTELKDAVASLQPLPKTMIVQKSMHGITLVDDTFNVNPQGVIAAIEYATVYKGKKYLVLEPMIELGSSGKHEHRKVGQMIAHSCDYLFLTKKNFANEVKQGIADKKGTCVVQVMKPKDIASFITKHASKSDIAIFEGKEAAVALHHIV